MKNIMCSALFMLIGLYAGLCFAAFPASDPGNSIGWIVNATYTDEFNGNSLNTAKWHDHHTYWKGRDSFFYSGNVSVGSGMLKLRFAKESMGGFKYTAACVQSKTKAPYGYYEVRAKIANASHTCSFWLQGSKTEIDVMEAIGNSTKYGDWKDREMPTNTHHFPNGWHSDQDDPKGINTGVRLADAFHTYGIEWDKNYMKWYFDGKLVRTVANKHHHENEYLFIDTEIFTWAGWPTDASLPSLFQVDYVRGWQRDPNGPGPVDPDPDPDASDQCNFTHECKALFGDRATDCLNSKSDHSICMCGDQVCENEDNDSPVLLPGIVEAEEYTDFFDQTSGNSGKQYRNDDVDIQKTTDNGGGYNVGWVDGNEWLEYEVDFSEAGQYRADVRVAAVPGTGLFTLELDGVGAGETFDVPSTGGWQNWTTITQDIGHVSKGRKTLLVEVLGGGFNINWIELVKIKDEDNDPEPTPDPGGSDQCDTTQECKDQFGSSATDCLNSRSDNSICMCGSQACEDNDPEPTPTPEPEPTPDPGGNDQCDTTQECKDQFGSSATDCKNSRSDNSICMCGSQVCEDTDPVPPGPTPDPEPDPTPTPGMLGKFEKGKDLLLANFDGKPDADDLHSVAALSTMLRDPRFAGVKYHATMGAVGKQGGTFIDATSLFNIAFGNQWANAKQSWSNAVTKAANKAISVLNNGGDIWVQEAGQSDFTADVVRKVKAQLPGVNTGKRVHVVQHSKWNENQTTLNDLSYVKNNTNYNKIPDGNSAGNGTPGYNTGNGSNWGRATSDPQTGNVWKEARRLANYYNDRSSYKNPSIAKGGFDFSDACEDTWIFGFNYIKNVDGFFNEFL